LPLRIAFDLDGVLADMEAELRRQAGLLFGDSLAGRAATAASSNDAGQSSASPASANLTTRQANRLWRHVESIEGFWESLNEIEPGAVARLGALAAERRWEVIFLTKRPDGAGATAQVQSQRWLEAHGFALPSVFVVQESRGRIAAALALDVVVDDRPENCLDVVAESPARPILVWRDVQSTLPPAAARLGVTIVPSVLECLDVLAALDTAAGKGTIVGRFMRLLRLRRESTTPPDPPAGGSRSRTPSPS
jgi:hypothetical protein